MHAAVLGLHYEPIGSFRLVFEFYTVRQLMRWRELTEDQVTQNLWGMSPGISIFRNFPCGYNVQPVKNQWQSLSRQLVLSTLDVGRYDYERQTPGTPLLFL